MGATPPPFPANPSPTPRGPRGVITRDFPNWYADDACTAFGHGIGALGTQPFVALNNNDPQGRDFRVYGLWAIPITNSVIAVVYLTQGTFGIPTGFVTAVDTVSSTPTGQIFAGGGNLVGQPIIYEFPSNVSGFNGWPYPFPIAILGTGDTLWVGCSSTNVSQDVGFWYIPTPVED